MTKEKRAAFIRGFAYGIKKHLGQPCECETGYDFASGYTYALEEIDAAAKKIGEHAQDYCDSFYRLGV